MRKSEKLWLIATHKLYNEWARKLINMNGTKANKWVAIRITEIENNMRLNTTMMDDWWLELEAKMLKFRKKSFLWFMMMRKLKNWRFSNSWRFRFRNAWWLKIREAVVTMVWIMDHNYCVAFNEFLLVYSSKLKSVKLMDGLWFDYSKIKACEW